MTDIEPSTETKQCSNCDQMIDKSKFMLHEAYCVRHMYKCQCGEVVCKEDKEEHEEEKHVLVKCQYCDFEALKHLFGDHEATCDKKPKECQFCEQMIRDSDFLQHVNFCGSRTRQCEFCKRNIMMRNQKYHEQEECAKFIREDYEKEQQKKIKELEEEEKRTNRVKEMQAKRRKMREDQNKAAAQPKPSAQPKTSSKPATKPPGGARALPSYFEKSSMKSSKPTGVSTRAKTGAKKEAPVVSKRPGLRNRDKKPINKQKEEAKMSHGGGVSKAPAKKTKLRDTKPTKAADPFVVQDPNIMNEIPAELLNQIYSEDLDSADIERIQQQEYGASKKQPRMAPPAIDNQPHQLLGPDADMEDLSQPEYRYGGSNRSMSPPAPVPGPSDVTESENDLLQRAIQESLKQGNPRAHPMPSNDLDSTMNDPEMLEAIARSMQND